jgi:hypothetical protein
MTRARRILLRLPNWTEFSEARLRRLVTVMGVLSVPLIVVLLVTGESRNEEPFPPELVRGCYETEGAPRVQIWDHSIRILQPTTPTLNFTLSPSKMGWSMEVAPAMLPEPSADGQYLFKPQPEPALFWFLTQRIGTRSAYLRYPSAYRGTFELVATDGEILEYGRIQTAPCS